LAGREVVEDVVELVGGLLLVLTDLLQPGFDLALGPVRFADEVEVAVFGCSYVRGPGRMSGRSTAAAERLLCGRRGTG
jgi:hypothetical protein